MRGETFSPTENRVRVLGRTYYNERSGIRWCVQSGSGIEFIAEGGPCSVELFHDDGLPVYGPMVRFQITVNGTPSEPVVLNERSATVSLGAAGTDRRSVRIVKLSESKRGILGVGRISLPQGGRVVPTDNRPKLIEFVGDSLTCGYGVEAKDPEEPFSIETENVTGSFAYMTARDLAADCSMVSFSGFGILSGYTEDDSVVPDLVPPLYDRVGSCDSTFDGGLRAQDIGWPFGRQPDLVVVNLGTNDSSYVRGDKNRAQSFSELYAGFIADVRSRNPQAAILCAYGMMESTLLTAVSDAVELYRKKSGDGRAFFCRLDEMDPSDGYGARWHPSEKAHRKAADQLTRFIAEQGLL